MWAFCTVIQVFKTLHIHFCNNGIRKRNYRQGLSAVQQMLISHITILSLLIAETLRCMYISRFKRMKTRRSKKCQLQCSVIVSFSSAVSRILPSFIIKETLCWEAENINGMQIGKNVSAQQFIQVHNIFQS